MTKIGPYHIECVVEFRVMEGSRIRLRCDDLDKAIQWADDELEAEREAEDRQINGDGTRAHPERRGVFVRGVVS